MKTTKLKKVLIALDYDPTAKKVVESGFSLATAMKAEVTLLHIISDPVYYASTAYSPIMGLSSEMEIFPMQLDNIEGLKEVSQHFLEKFKRHLGDETIKTLVEEGDFASTILKTAKSIHADVIVMGSHSKKWLENIVMGSVTGNVLRHTTIPLFIVPTKKPE
ncbi:MAG: universal stress protein [Lentimicrobiaceae bacterium]|jgi:nucleotide-binding universal stress UspA family protein